MPNLSLAVPVADLTSQIAESCPGRASRRPSRSAEATGGASSPVASEGRHEVRDALAPVLPPPTNRGVTVTWQGVHWFAGTVRGLAASAVVDIVSAHLNVKAQTRSRGGYGYAHSAVLGQASVYWSPGRADVFVVLPGETCEALGIPGLVALATDLDLDPTSRLDLAWDVEGVPVLQVADAWHAGHTVTRAHKDSWKHERNAQGETFYMGSRTSGRMVRVYDRRGPTRFEMEWKEDRAVLLWRRLLACGESGWSAEAMSELRAFLDFRERAEGVNPQRCPLLPWWDAVTDGAGRSCVTVPRAARTLDDKRQWLRDQVAPVLAMVADGVPDWESEVLHLLENGRRRYRGHADRVAMVELSRAGWSFADAAD